MENTDNNVLKGGLADNKSVQDIANKHNTTVEIVEEQIAKGVKVELEHTSDEQVAYEIAKDHVYENLFYYVSLEKMESGATQKYYKAVFKDLGEVTTFKPNNYLDAVGENNEPLFDSEGKHKENNFQEVNASKTIGGALIEVYGNVLHWRFDSDDIVYIYEITETPSCDVSHWHYGGYDEMSEVRYNTNVTANYLRSIKLTKELIELLENYFAYWVWLLDYNKEGNDGTLPSELQHIHDLTEEGRFVEEVEKLAHITEFVNALEVEDRTYRLAPNGKRSNLSNQQYDLVRSDAFIAWFGNWLNDKENSSKVLDSNGEPLVLHHATQATKEFNVFKQTKLPYFYFAQNKTYCEKFSKNINSYFLNIRYLYNGLQFGIEKYNADELLDMIYAEMGKTDNKTEFVEFQKKWFNEKLQNAIDYDYYFDFLEQFWGIIKLQGMKEVLFGGYDGMVFEEEYGLVRDKVVDKDVWTVAYTCFNNTQMKLANGQNTTFNGDSDDIRFEEGGAVEDKVIITEKQLINLGFKPSRQFNEILTASKNAQESGVFTNEEEGIKWVCDNYIPSTCEFKEGGSMEERLQTQSLIFSKEYFTKAQAIKWAKSHGHKSDVDETAFTYRFRQVEPSEFKKDTFVTIKFADGLQAVLGHLIPKKEEGGVVIEPTFEEIFSLREIGSFIANGEKITIYDIDASAVRTRFPQFPQSIDWNSGGHHRGWGNGGMEFIEDNCIWIDNSATDKAKRGFILHEASEFCNMKYNNMDYDKAHNIANDLEQCYLKEYDSLKDKNPINYLLKSDKDNCKYSYTDKNVEGRTVTKLVRALGENGFGDCVVRLNDTEAVITIANDKENGDLFNDIIDFAVGKNNIKKITCDNKTQISNCVIIKNLTVEPKEIKEEGGAILSDLDKNRQRIDELNQEFLKAAYNQQFVRKKEIRKELDVLEQEQQELLSGSKKKEVAAFEQGGNLSERDLFIVNYAKNLIDNENCDTETAVFLASGRWLLEGKTNVTMPTESEVDEIKKHLPIAILEEGGKLEEKVGEVIYWNVPIYAIKEKGVIRIYLNKQTLIKTRKIKDKSDAKFICDSLQYGISLGEIYLSQAKFVWNNGVYYLSVKQGMVEDLFKLGKLKSRAKEKYDLIMLGAKYNDRVFEEGGKLSENEVVIKRTAVLSDKTHEFEGQQKTIKEILTIINTEHGGNPITKQQGNDGCDNGCQVDGKRHIEGGETMVINESKQVVELEVDEAVIKSDAVLSSKTYTFDGKTMTPKEILHIINTEFGGKAILEQGGNLKKKENAEYGKGGVITIDTKDYDKFGRIGITDDYTIEAIKLIGLQEVNFSKERILSAIEHKFQKLCDSATRYVVQHDSTNITKFMNTDIRIKTYQCFDKEYLDKLRANIDNQEARIDFLNQYKKHQLDTVRDWVNHLRSAEYEAPFKYLLLHAILNYNYNYKEQEFIVRTSKTLRNFIPFNANSVKELYVMKSKNLIQDYVTIESICAYEVIKNRVPQVKDENGGWYLFEGGINVSEEERKLNAQDLCRLVQDTYWCTRTNAKSHVDGGDFYVYVMTKGHNSQARIAIRMEYYKVAEVCGNKTHLEELEEDLIPIANNFIETYLKEKYDLKYEQGGGVKESDEKNTEEFKNLLSLCNLMLKKQPNNEEFKDLKNLCNLMLKN